MWKRLSNKLKKAYYGKLQVLESDRFSLRILLLWFWIIVESAYTRTQTTRLHSRFLNSHICCLSTHINILIIHIFIIRIISIHFISLLLRIAWGYSFNTTITLLFVIWMESRGKIVFALFYHSIAIYQNVWAGKNNVKVKMNKMGYEMNNNIKPCLCSVVRK